MIKIRYLLLLSLLITLIGYSNSAYAAADHATEEQLIEINGAMKAPDQCDNPTAKLTITSPISGGSDFDQDEYKVEKDTCVELTFYNPSAISHDLSIEEVEGEAGIEFVHLNVANNKVGPNSDGKISMNILTPNADTVFDIHCTLKGHAEAGMKADLIVGNGNASDEGGLPGFGLITTLLGLFTVGVIVLKRKN